MNYKVETKHNLWEVKMYRDEYGSEEEHIFMSAPDKKRVWYYLTKFLDSGEFYKLTDFFGEEDCLFSKEFGKHQKKYNYKEKKHFLENKLKNSLVDVSLSNLSPIGQYKFGKKPVEETFAEVKSFTFPLNIEINKINVIHVADCD